MFKIEIDNEKEFRAAVDAIVNLIDEGAFTINEEGLGLKALDPSQIAMVIFRMPKGAFSEFEVDGPQTVGLNLTNLSKILSRGKGSKLTIKSEDHRVEVIFTSGKSRKSFKVNTIDVGPSIDREPKVEHDAHVVMNAGALKDAIKDIALVSSHVTFEAKGDTLIIEASGDNAEAKIEYEKGEDAELKDIEVKSVARATFPVQFLEDMIKGAEDGGNVEIFLKTNAPLKLHYKVGSAEFDYYLAPRIDLE